jgi:peptide/nickel transport system substrate-binding protein
MKKEGKLKMISNPIGNGMYSLEMNVVNPPFNNAKVRQAVAYAIPYQKIVDAAMFDIGNPLSGGKSNDVTTINWPQPTGYSTDIAKAKALMQESGAGAIDTTISATP